MTTMATKRPAGEEHHKAQLTDAQVRVIRALREFHGWPLSRIAELHGLNRRTVANFVTYLNRRSAGQPLECDRIEAAHVVATYEGAIVTAATALRAFRNS